MKKKYFTTRQWGFGSNIVNFLKSALFCEQNGYELVLQDKYNTIGSDYNLFSVIEIPGFVKRTNNDTVIPIEDLKSLVKFNLYGKLPYYKKMYYSLWYVSGMNSEIFIKNFNHDQEINSYFISNYKKHIGGNLLTCWKYTEEIKNVFRKYDEEYKFENYHPDLAIQIRGGDKIEELRVLGVNKSSIDDYLKICFEELAKIEKFEISVYVMTDTFSFFQVIRDKIIAIYPNADVRSLADPSQEGYSQTNFEGLDRNVKISAYYFFLYELEMLRKARVCVGSFNSNIFYLASLIRYDKESKFISVDTTVKNSFL